jgi:hypothetical protein
VPGGVGAQKGLPSRDRLPDLLARGAVANLRHDHQPFPLDGTPAQVAAAVGPLFHALEGCFDVGEDHAGGGGELDVNLMNLDLSGGALLEPLLDAGDDRAGELPQLLLAEQALLMRFSRSAARSSADRCVGLSTMIRWFTMSPLRGRRRRPYGRWSGGAASAGDAVARVGQDLQPPPGTALAQPAQVP